MIGEIRCFCSSLEKDGKAKGYRMDPAKYRDRFYGKVDLNGMESHIVTKQVKDTLFAATV